jgi:hypothetical protein
MSFRVVCFALLLSCLAATTAAAQTAAGLPSFEEGPFLVTAGAMFGEDSKGFGVGFAGGTDELFAGVSLGFTSIDDVDANATSFAAHVGTSFALDGAVRTYVAPVASASFTSGPDIGPVDVSIAGLRGGVRVGFVASDTGELQIVPTFGFDVAYDRVSTDIDDLDVSDTYGIIRLGVGLLVTPRVSVLPIVSVPVGVDDSDAEFAIVVGFNLGRR